MKDYHQEWSVTIVSNKGEKGKQQVEGSSSQKTNSPTTNT
jgi:hypothetical protein